jgi:metal-responsive CopG/Arc/MetJ family transcriptional regulator
MQKLAEEVTQLHIVMPKELIELIDAWAEKQSLNRSQAIRLMLEQKLLKGRHAR